MFCDLRQYTSFSESSEPEEVMRVLNEYHAAMGDLVFRFGGTLERFTGDGLMVIFNDPLPSADPNVRAIEMAVAMRTRMRDLAAGWGQRGHDLGFGVGIAQGFATLGRIGFQGRYEYSAIGTVVNLSARLCAAARSWQILVTQRVLTGADGYVLTIPLGDLELRGFSRPVRTFDIEGLDAAKAPS